MSYHWPIAAVDGSTRALAAIVCAGSSAEFGQRVDAGLCERKEPRLETVEAAIDFNACATNDLRPMAGWLKATT